MNYESGEVIELGDVVRFDVGPERYITARVMMLGETREHLKLEQSFFEWVERDAVLEESAIVVERLSESGVPEVGSYMFTCLGGVELVEKGRIWAGT